MHLMHLAFSQSFLVPEIF